MPRITSVYCCECDHEVEAEVIHDDQGTFLDYPDDCPACGEPMNGAALDPNEDFHSDI